MAVASEVSKVGVIGCGLMGSGIAEVCAKAGVDVIVYEPTEGALEAGRARVSGSFERAVAKDRISRAEADGALGRLRYTTELDSFADRDLSIEAIVEDEQAKVELFGRLDKILTSPDAILASNTSSIPIIKIAMATARPAQVVGIHFFNPVPVLRLVELVPSLLTAPATTDRAQAFAEGTLGKTTIRSKDKAGFVVNSLLVPFILSAIRMLEAGFASAQDIDNGMVLGCAHPVGPLALADLIGLDTVKAVADSMYEEFKEPLYAAPPLLLRMVAARLLGRKSSRGFYEY
jgi:3-hydroxybutyryl-CoA dehydrogenase